MRPHFERPKGPVSSSAAQKDTRLRESEGFEIKAESVEIETGKGLTP